VFPGPNHGSLTTLAQLSKNGGGPPPGTIGGKKQPAGKKKGGGRLEFGPGGDTMPLRGSTSFYSGNRGKRVWLHGGKVPWKGFRVRGGVVPGNPSKRGMLPGEGGRLPGAAFQIRRKKGFIHTAYRRVYRERV